MIDSFAAPTGTAGEGASFYSFDKNAFPTLVPVSTMTVPSFDPASILGGDRDLVVQVVGPPDWKSVAGTIGSADETLSVATWGPSGSTTMLSYPSLAGMDLTSAGTNDVIDFAFNFLEVANMNLSVGVTGAGGTAVFDSAASTLGDLTPSSTPFVYSVPLDEFVITGSDPLINADSLTVMLNGPVGGLPAANLDFELDSICLSPAKVPEPSTLAMLFGLGLCLAVTLRRQQKR